METLWQDVKYGARTLAKSPGFVVVAAITLALGIGANAAMFSVTDAFLLKPLPFPEIDRLAMLLQTRAGAGGDNWYHVSPANLRDWKEQTRAFEQVAAYQWWDTNLTGAGEPERPWAFRVTANLFDTLGQRPLLGRAFRAEEEQPGRDQVLILAHGYWQRRFGGDPTVIGRMVKLDGKAFEIIGVMGKEMSFPRPVDIWIPLAMTPEEAARRDVRAVLPVARLKPGVSLEAAQAELRSVAARLEEAYPAANKGWGARVMGFREFLVSKLTRNYTLLCMGAVFFVLLIACLNVANLQLARSAGRVHEVAVRTALGASRWRVLRQLLTESVLVSLLGGSIGVLVALWSVDMILAYMPPEVARWIVGWESIRLDARAFAYTLGLAVLAGLIAGAAPALRGSRSSVNDALRQGTRSVSGSRGGHRLRGVLVAVQIGLALVLLVGAGLMVRGVRTLFALNQDFQPASVLTLRLNLPEPKYTEAARRAAFYDQVLERFAAVNGVQSAALASHVPFADGGVRTRTMGVEGQAEPDPSNPRWAYFQSVSAGYLKTMHIPLRQGREFDERDTAEGVKVALISESFAKNFFPGQDPIGRRVRIGKQDADQPWWTVAGVVAEVRNEWIENSTQPTVYVPYKQAPLADAYLVARTAGDPMDFAGALRAALARVDGDRPVFEVMPLERVIYNSVLGISYVAAILGVLGGVALVLACVGVYAMMSYSVSERTHEIGLRMALGARMGDVLRMVMRRGLLLTVAGMVVGLVASAGLAQLLSSLLFGVSATDLLTFGGVSLLLIGVAALACWLPARRAAKIDPMVALRYE